MVLPQAVGFEREGLGMSSINGLVLIAIAVAFVALVLDFHQRRGVDQ